MVVGNVFLGGHNRGGIAIRRYFVGGWRLFVFGGNDCGGGGKRNYGSIFSAVTQYGGNFGAVGVFLFFGGNDFGGSGKPK